MEAALIDRRTRDSSTEAIEDDLSALWREAGREAPVARALMANLIVVREGANPRDLGIPLDAVVRRHPSRVILLAHAATAAAARPGRAVVTVVTFGPPRARYGVEEIAVDATCADASLPSIVRRVARGDVPTSIWWTDDVSRVPPIASLTRMARQLVYDSRRWRDVRGAVRVLAPLLQDPDAPQLADVNWRRVTSMRHAIVHAARTMMAGARTIETVEIRHRPGDAALAWLVAGWLAARLGWRDAPWPLRVEEVRHGDEWLSVHFDSVTATMNGSRIVVQSPHRRPFQVAARQESDADAVVAELNTLTPDPCLRDALAALARL